MNPLGFRLTNVLIHALNCFLVYRLIGFIFKEKKVALLASFIFCILPIHGVTINHIVGRCDLLQYFFLLLASLNLAYYLEENKRSKFTLSLLFFTAALFSREVAITYPLRVIIICLCYLRDIRKILLVSLPYFVMSLLYFILRLIAYPIVTHGTFLPLSFEEFARWAAHSVELTIRFVFPWSAQAALLSASDLNIHFTDLLIVLLGIFIIGILFLKKTKLKYRKEFIFGWLWILVSILPLFVLEGIIEKLGSYFSEYLLYFSSIGFAVVFSAAVLNLNKYFQRLFVIVFTLYYISLAVYTNSFWKSERDLVDRVRTLERSDRYVAGMQMLMKYEDNEEKIKKIIRETDNPSVKSIWLKRIGLIARQTKNYDKAIEYFKEAVRLSPSNAEACNALAIAYFEIGKAKEGMAWLKKSLAVNSEDAETYRLLGEVFYNHNDYPVAISYFKKAVYYDPDNVESLQHLVISYFLNHEKGNYLELIDFIGKKSGEIIPTVRFVALELFRHGDFQNTAYLLEKTKILFPKDTEMLTLLARAYALLGQDEKALEVQKDIQAVIPLRHE